MAENSPVPKLWSSQGIRSAPDNDLNQGDLQVVQVASPASWTLNVRTGSAWVQDIFRRRNEFIVKQIDEERTNSDTLSDDENLKVTLIANTRYRVRVCLYFDTHELADFKWRHTGPASPTLVRLRRQWLAPGASAWDGIACDTAYSTGDLVVAGGSPPAVDSNGGVVIVEGIIHNGANQGLFTVQWAQNVAQVGQTTRVRAGSSLDFQYVPEP